MVKILSVLSEYFAFTTTRNREAHYYEQSIFKSRYFRGYTTTMACTEIVGIYMCGRYWSAMPWMSQLFLVLALLSLIGAWGRAISNHARMRKTLESIDLSGLPSELLKEAAGESNFGLALLGSVVLMLIFALAFTIARLEFIIANVRHGVLR